VPGSTHGTRIGAVMKFPCSLGELMVDAGII
jgi:hypothetical protein